MFLNKLTIMCPTLRYRRFADPAGNYVFYDSTRILCDQTGKPAVVTRTMMEVSDWEAICDHPMDAVVEVTGDLAGHKCGKCKQDVFIEAIIYRTRFPVMPPEFA